LNSFADFFWYMIEFYILFMIIWIFIRVFADIFRRTDMTGVMKGLWVLCIFIIPFFGALVYIITRPKTAGDLEFSAGAAGAAPTAAVPATVPASGPAASASVADQIAKLSALHDAGTLTDDEYEAAKAKALA
jgi:uncharacterized membrane protein